MGLNEFAGYLAVAGAAFVTGFIAARSSLRPEPFYLGVVFVAAGLVLSTLLVRETAPFAAQESVTGRAEPMPSPSDVFKKTSFADPNLSSVSQVGFVNNLNDGVAWGLFPLFYLRAGMTIDQIGILAAIYPATWGVFQLAAGALSDSIGRKPLIVFGMWVQAIGIGIVVIAARFREFSAGLCLLGVGTAMVYPTLLSAVGDVVPPSWRASSVGVYRVWRDLGYAAGALVGGVIADAFGLAAAMSAVAVATFISGVMAALRMTETLHS